MTEGDCYARAGRIILGTPKSNKVLCHGKVFHPKTGWHGHAWVEYDDKVFDKIEWPKAAYYHISKAKNVRKYNSKLANHLMLKRGHFGPWRMRK